MWVYYYEYVVKYNINNMQFWVKFYDKAKRSQNTDAMYWDMTSVQSAPWKGKKYTICLEIKQKRTNLWTCI